MSPGMSSQMLGMGPGTEFGDFPGRPPHFHRIASTCLGQGSRSGRHIADVVGVQVGQNTFGRRCDRKSQAVELAGAPEPIERRSPVQDSRPG